MPDAPRKSTRKDPRPNALSSLGFGLMLAAWWIITVEIPGRNLFLIAAQRGVERTLAPITLWVFDFTQQASLYRGWALALIIIAVLIHRWLWVRRQKWDVFGKWVFKAGFFILYVILYGLFLVVFVGAELPIWRSRL